MDSLQHLSVRVNERVSDAYINYGYIDLYICVYLCVCVTFSVACAAELFLLLEYVEKVLSLALLLVSLVLLLLLSLVSAA